MHKRLAARLHPSPMSRVLQAALLAALSHKGRGRRRYLRATTISNPIGRSVTFAFSPTRAPGASCTR